MDHNIILHGPTIPRGGTVARRVVLRDLSRNDCTEYVVHTQCFHKDGSTSYENGAYFVGYHGRPAAKPTGLRQAAIQRFNERVKKNLDNNPRNMR